LLFGALWGSSGKTPARPLLARPPARTVKDLSPEDRPREKLHAHGPRALGDNELVAVVIGSGCHGRDALAVGNALLAARGGLHGLVQACCDDLARVAGIGPVRAAQLVAAVELGRRTLLQRPRARLQLQTPQQAAAFLMPAFSGRGVEQFGVILLDTKHRVIRTTVITVGTLDSATVEPRDVFREAALGGAAAIVLFHNHPSGDPTPSAEDVDLTRRLVAAGVLMGIDVVDHIVLGDVRYCSFKEMGRI
jgi:DNA repair protein RadC